MHPHNVALTEADRPELVARVRELIEEYAHELGIDLEYQGFAAELAALPVPYTPPLGALFIAYVDGEPAGCAALRPLGASVGEMKRLYVRQNYRKVGIGEQLVNAIIHTAREASLHELRLDTLSGMAAAQALYLKLGFVERPPYNEKYLPGTRFFALALK